jgi:RNA polymerase sigma factor (sigma-70 family)
MVDQALHTYARTGSADAFKALVDRHGTAVYAQCVRQLRNSHLAEDVTQAVFMVLARKARSLPENLVLAAWLFKVTRYACANARRSELRRARHEQEAAMMRSLEQDRSAEVGVSELEIVLDDALARLGRTDRNAIVLKYYSGLSAPGVAEQLGVSADAAKRRLSRALQKLRDMLTQSGLKMTPAAVLDRLELVSTTALPEGLASKVLLSAMNPAGASSTGVAVARGVIHMMRWMRIKLISAAAMVVAVAGVGGQAVVSALTQQSPGAPTVAGTTAQVAPENAPAEEALDRAAIRSTLELAAHAIRVNDIAALNKCIKLSPDDDNSPLVEAMLLENVAYRHLQNAWAAKFASPVRFNGIGFVWIPAWDGGAETILEKTLEGLRDSNIQLSGKHARIPAAQNRPELGEWRGIWLHLVNDQGAWKLDLNKTARVVVSMTFQPGRQPASADQEMKIAIEQKKGFAQLLEKAAVDIENGKFPTAAAAARRVENDSMALQRGSGLAGSNYGFAPARPKSTEIGG